MTEKRQGPSTALLVIAAILLATLSCGGGFCTGAMLVSIGQEASSR